MFPDHGLHVLLQMMQRQEDGTPDPFHVPDEREAWIGLEGTWRDDGTIFFFTLCLL